MTNAKALEGMRIVEMSSFIAAPLAGMTLAQLGADVIRVDQPRGGLDYRRWPVTDANDSLFWRGMNKSKRSVAVDTATPEGREIITALICAPDPNGGIFLSNLPARGWRAYENLSARRGDLIQFELKGEHSGRSAIDNTVNCTVGIPTLTGPVNDDRPVNHVLPAWDLITGQSIAAGLLVAERRRLRTGEGQFVSLALKDVALATMGNLGFIAEAQLGTPRTRQGNDIYGGFGRDFLCGDGSRIMLVGLTLKQWRSISAAMKLDEAVAAIASASGLNLDEEGSRYLVRTELASLVERWLSGRTIDQVREIFTRHDVLWAPYQTVDEMIARDIVGDVDNPLFQMLNQHGVGTHLVPANPLNFSGEPPLAHEGAPELGQHTEQVLSEIVGLSGAHIARLCDDGIVLIP